MSRSAGKVHQLTPYIILSLTGETPIAWQPHRSLKKKLCGAKKNTVECGTLTDWLSLYMSFCIFFSLKVLINVPLRSSLCPVKWNNQQQELEFWFCLCVCVFTIWFEILSLDWHVQASFGPPALELKQCKKKCKKVPALTTLQHPLYKILRSDGSILPASLWLPFCEAEFQNKLRA